MNLQEINNRHKERWAEALATYGDQSSIPVEVLEKIAEASREDWEAHNKTHKGTTIDRSNWKEEWSAEDGTIDWEAVHNAFACECGWFKTSSKSTASKANQPFDPANPITYALTEAEKASRMKKATKEGWTMDAGYWACINENPNHKGKGCLCYKNMPKPKE
jgi:hypothetical protein